MSAPFNPLPMAQNDEGYYVDHIETLEMIPDADDLKAELDHNSNLLVNHQVIHAINQMLLSQQYTRNIHIPYVKAHHSMPGIRKLHKRGFGVQIFTHTDHECYGSKKHTCSDIMIQVKSKKPRI